MVVANAPDVDTLFEGLPGSGVGIVSADLPLDTRLISLVQSRAGGAHVHKAAGLLQAYISWGAVRRQAHSSGNAVLYWQADQEVRHAAAELRLFRCRLRYDDRKATAVTSRATTAVAV